MQISVAAETPVAQSGHSTAGLHVSCEAAPLPGRTTSLGWPLSFPYLSHRAGACVPPHIRAGRLTFWQCHAPGPSDKTKTRHHRPQPQSGHGAAGSVPRSAGPRPATELGDVRRRRRRLGVLVNDLRIVMIYHIRCLFRGGRHKRREMLVIGCGGQLAMSVGGPRAVRRYLGERLRSKTYRLLTAI